MFVFKCIISQHVNRHFVTPNLHTRYQTRNNATITVPFMISSQSQSNIRYHGAKIYNSLPEHIKSKTSVSSFKFSLKKYLLDKYMEDISGHQNFLSALTYCELSSALSVMFVTVTFIP